MTPILSVTLNPTVDFATAADHVVPDIKLRCARNNIDPGGGGINVSRAVQILGGHSTAFVAVGGQVGDKLIHLLAEAGIGLAPFPAPDETRQSFSVTDRGSGAQYRFVMPGPTWRPRDVDMALSRIARAAPSGGIVVLSGSQPPGVPADFPARLAARVARTGARLVVDTSGAALKEIATHPRKPAFILRMDGEEAEELAGRVLDSRADSADFAQSLITHGAADIVIVARGGDGNVLVTPKARWHATAPKVPIVSKVGAGDSFVGALVLALAQDKPAPEALIQGAAAAASAVMTDATRLCVRADVKRLSREVVLSRV